VETVGAIGIISIAFQLVFLESILSIDNAAVLGALVSVLPDDKPVPYPRQLKSLQSFTDRVLGMQQMAALKVGLLGAYLGRAMMLVMAAWVIRNPFLQVLGAVYLVKLAFGHLSVADQPGEEKLLNQRRTAATSFWLVVLKVELADLAFSLDNVVAALALSDELWVVMLGVALGIVTMRFAAGVFTWLIKREPILETAAYIVVLNIGVELLLAQYFHIHLEAWQKFIISASTIVLCVVYARVKFLHILAPVFRWIGEGMGNFDELINWALRPVILVIKLIASLIGKFAAYLLNRKSHEIPSQEVLAHANPGLDSDHVPDIITPGESENKEMNVW
jgi:tellurite resistance protein TerC